MFPRVGQYTVTSLLAWLQVQQSLNFEILPFDPGKIVITVNKKGEQVWDATQTQVSCAGVRRPT